MIRRRAVLAGASALLSILVAGRAPAAAAPTAAPILTLRGRDAASGEAREIRVTLSDLDHLPQTRFSTGTPWHEGPQTFSGVALSALIAAHGLGGTRVRLLALNDYMVEAEVAELVEAEALLATREDGQPMPVTDKGPVFVVFPFDRRGELRHQAYFSRAVWQLADIEMLD